jgi:hypothetical protein
MSKNTKLVFNNYFGLQEEKIITITEKDMVKEVEGIHKNKFIQMKLKDF